MIRLETTDPVDFEEQRCPAQNLSGIPNPIPNFLQYPLNIPCDSILVRLNFYQRAQYMVIATGHDIDNPQERWYHSF
jgi:hypothetical protein